MYLLKETTKFKKDIKKIVKRNSKDTFLIKHTLLILKEKGVEGIELKMNPHKLKGLYNNNWECHIKQDLLIIWFQIESPKVFKLIRIGSHSDLFN